MWRAALISVLMTMINLSAIANPYRPAADSEIIERLPKGLLFTNRGRTLTNTNPIDIRNYIHLGQVNGEPRYIHFAQGLVEKLQPGSEKFFLKGMINQYLHHFSEAEADFTTCLKTDGPKPDALVQLAMLYVVQGRYSDARRTLARSPHLLGTGEGMTVLAILSSLNGQLNQSYAFLIKRYEAGQALPGSEALFVLATLAEMAIRRGDTEKSDEFLALACAKEPENVPILTQRADLLLVQKRYYEVIKIGREHTANVGLQLREAIALKAVLPRSTCLKQLSRELQARLFDSSGSAHLREQAMFELFVNGNPSRALDLAIKNFELQREPADARLVIESAAQAKQAGKAAPVLFWLKETRLEDVQLQKALASLEREF